MNDTDYTAVTEDEAFIAIVVLWQDGEEVAYALRQGDTLPASRPAPSQIMELEDIPF